MFLSEHKRTPKSPANDIDIEPKLFLPVLLLPTPPIVATTLEDLKYTRPPDSRPPTGYDQAKQFHRHPWCCCIPPPGGRVSTQWSLLTYLLAGAQSGQLLLRLGDLDAIKDDDQNDDDHHNHHLVIKPPRALVISLKRVLLLLLKEISTPTPCTKIPSTGNTL